MPNKPVDPSDKQLETIPFQSPFVQQSFDLAKQDKFVSGLAVRFVHYKAIPSPIGENDRGDYRRSDGVDTITSNGMIYKCAGKFMGTMTDNSRMKKGIVVQESTLDPSQANLIIPRHYEDGTVMRFSEGDRVYVCDADADVLVTYYHKMDYIAAQDNVPIFPIVEMDQHCPLIDSAGIEYVQGRDFCITKEGNIRWHTGGAALNPGLDSTTGKGKIYAIRYLYTAYWYVMSIPKEVRMTNVTMGGIRGPQRMAYNLTVMREYMFHNKNRDDATPLPGATTDGKPDRADAPPQPNGNAGNFVIPVDMDDIDQS